LDLFLNAAQLLLECLDTNPSLFVFGPNALALVDALDARWRDERAARIGAG
jgi:hypothetical protein